MKRRLLKFTIEILLVIIIVIVAATYYLFNVALKTHIEPNDEQRAYAYLFRHDYLKRWIDSLNVESALRDTFIYAADGCKLHALYVKSSEPTAKTAIMLHGYGDNSIRMLKIGNIYSERLSYNIILPDFRGHGKTGGNYVQMGWKDTRDIHDWINMAINTFGDSTKIVLHGISMGASAAMMVSADSLPHNVRCIVEDCGYTSVWDEFESELKVRYNLPAFPLLYTASWLTEFKFGWNFKEASALEQVKKSHLPMFFIHGDSDTFVPTYMVHELFNAKPGNDKELWVVPDTNHAMSYWNHTDEYTKRTIDFVGRYMN